MPLNTGGGGGQPRHRKHRGGGHGGSANGGQQNGGGGNGGGAHGGTVQPTAENFFKEFLQGLGLPVTQSNLNALYGVAQLEGWNDRYNPLNVVQPEPGSHSINSVGVQAFADFDSGVKASVTLFSGSHWNGVRQALAQGNNAQGVLNAFKSAYTWDPGVQFPMGQPSWGTKMIGANAGSGNPGGVTGVSGNAGGGFSGSGTDNGGTHASQQDYKNELGDLAGLLNSVPELRQLLNKAMAQGWTTQQFLNQVEDSHWYKTHSSSVRSVLAERVNDPATYEQRLEQAIQNVNDIANQAGFSLDRGQPKNIARAALLQGQDTNQQWILEQIGHKQDYSDLKNPDNLTGNMAATIDQLQQTAAAYGFQYHDPQALAGQARNVVAGYTTLDTYKQRWIERAKSMFPGLADQIDAGQTVQEIADPYAQTMANLLEIDPSQLGPQTRLIRQALQGTQAVKDGNSTKPVVTPLWQFEDQVRNDPRWQYTDNARSSAADMLMQLGQEWGFAA